MRAKDFLAALRYVKQHTTAEESRRDLEQRRRETPAKLMPKSSVHLLQWMLAEDALLVAMGLPGEPWKSESAADEAMAEIYEIDRLCLKGASSMLWQKSRDGVSRLEKIRETGVFAPTDECSTADALMELLGQVGGELKRKRELAEAVRAADTSVEAQLAEAARVSELEAAKAARRRRRRRRWRARWRRRRRRRRPRRRRRRRRRACRRSRRSRGGGGPARRRTGTERHPPPTEAKAAKLSRAARRR